MLARNQQGELQIKILKSLVNIYPIMILQCEKCKGMNVFFLRSEPVFNSEIGIEPSLLRELYECRDCGHEFSTDKKL
jgi:hypothetical protein